MSIVSIDTHVVIWGIKEQATQGQEVMIPRTKAFLKHLQDERHKILIPSVVVAELLIKIPPNLHTAFNNLVERGFIVPPFDTKAAAQFARIWIEQHEHGLLNSMDQENDNYTREWLKLDCMIVATAVAAGSAALYSHDPYISRFSQGQIPVYEIPEVPEQLSFLENNY